MEISEARGGRDMTAQEKMLQLLQKLATLRAASNRLLDHSAEVVKRAAAARHCAV